MMVRAGFMTCSPIFSFRKLVPRAIEVPLIADVRWRTRLGDIRGSNTTGKEFVAPLRGFSLATARSPAVRPISSGARKSAPCTVVL